MIKEMLSSYKFPSFEILETSKQWELHQSAFFVLNVAFNKVNYFFSAKQLGLRFHSL